MTTMDRLDRCARDWGVTVESTLDTQSSILAFGTRDDRPVVLKVVRAPGDEWHAGEILAAFRGEGAVRVLAHLPGAALLERVVPGTPLTSLVLEGRDDEATGILGDVIRRMGSSGPRVNGAATAEEWGRGFRRYRDSGDAQVPAGMVDRAGDTYASLCASQQRTRLLHGDLQHYNVLLDADRGWLAIDPKGVVGEVEYELGASLRNPGERPDLFASAAIVERRVALHAARLGIDADRTLRWAYAQAVLSAIWTVEDGFPVSPAHLSLQLARAIEPLLGRQST
jgi:streptomycin 6-kinase